MTCSGLKIFIESRACVNTQCLCYLKTKRDFLGGPVVKNLPCNAGDMGSIPGYGTKIPYAMEQLSFCTKTNPKVCVCVCVCVHAHAHTCACVCTCGRWGAGEGGVSLHQ